MPIPSETVAASRPILADVLYDRLLAAIVSGELQPGEKLSDSSVAAWAGVSRTPVREALDRLARVHLVEVFPRRGTVVARVDHTRYADTLEALGPVVEETMRLVVRLSGESDRRVLASAVRGAAGAPDLFGAGGPFDRVTELLGNDRLRRAWLELTPHVVRAWNVEPDLVPPGLTSEEIQCLTLAVGDGDGDGAAGVVRGWFLPHRVHRAVHEDPIPDELPPVSLPEPALLRKHAFDTVYGALLDGTLVPGEELNDAALHRWLDMSRQPVRHALVRLSEYGLIEMVPNRQPRVARLDPGRTNRMLLLSLTWNLFTVERTVGSLSADALDELAAATGEYAATASGSDLSAKGYALQRVFAVFTRALGNAVLEEQMAVQSYELSGMLRPGGSLLDPSTLVRPLEQLCAAASAGDVHGAVVVIRAFLDVTIANFIDRFRQ